VNPFRALFARATGSPEASPQSDVHSPTGVNRGELQGRTHTEWGFPKILSYVDMHQKDGFPDVVSSPAGGRYMGVQALSLRNPDDARWLLDSQGTPIWLRTAATANEEQRTGLSPMPAGSPYTVEAAHVAAYRGIPPIGRGPGTMLVVPLQQIND
jgi:hypothetical protein